MLGILACTIWIIYLKKQQRTKEHPEEEDATLENQSSPYLHLKKEGIMRTFLLTSVLTVDNTEVINNCIINLRTILSFCRQLSLPTF